MTPLMKCVILTGLYVISCAAIANNGRSYERETIKTGARGTTSVSVNQAATANGWIRDRVVTNPNGKIADRHTEVVRNPSTGVVTRSVNGRQFNGKIYSKDSTRTPTNSGFIKQTTQLTPNGKNIEKLKIVERHASERTVDVTRVNGHGQISHRITHTQRK